MKKVLILLATYNGEKYLEEQIDSIVAQKNVDWKILASDDGSSDKTISMLQSYQSRLGAEKIVIIQGPKQGFAKNFLYLIDNAELDFDYYAFCDQDDIWYENKLFTAIQALEKQNGDKPCLYAGRTKLIDENNAFIGYSPLFKKNPSFENALVQSIAGGNTMVFNQNAFEIIKFHNKLDVVSHDWFIYQLITSRDGIVIYDPIPQILYRQHSQNLIGSNQGFISKVSRLKKLLNNSFRSWNTINLKNLQSSYIFFSDRNKKIYDQFCYSRQKGIIKRLVGFNRSKVYRQTFTGNIALWLGVFLNKI